MGWVMQRMNYRQFKSTKITKEEYEAWCSDEARDERDRQERAADKRRLLAVVAKIDESTPTWLFRYASLVLTWVRLLAVAWWAKRELARTKSPPLPAWDIDTRMDRAAAILRNPRPVRLRERIRAAEMMTSDLKWRWKMRFHRTILHQTADGKLRYRTLS